MVASILNQTHITTFREHLFYEMWVLAERIIGVLGRVLRTHERRSVRAKFSNREIVQA